MPDDSPEGLDKLWKTSLGWIEEARKEAERLTPTREHAAEWLAQSVRLTEQVRESTRHLASQSGFSRQLGDFLGWPSEGGSVDPLQDYWDALDACRNESKRPAAAFLTFLEPLLRDLLACLFNTSRKEVTRWLRRLEPSGRALVPTDRLSTRLLLIQRLSLDVSSRQPLSVLDLPRLRFVCLDLVAGGQVGTRDLEDLRALLVDLGRAWEQVRFYEPGACRPQQIAGSARRLIDACSLLHQWLVEILDEQRSETELEQSARQCQPTLVALIDDLLLRLPDWQGGISIPGTQAKGPSVADLACLLEAAVEHWRYAITEGVADPSLEDRPSLASLLFAAMVEPECEWTREERESWQELTVSAPTLDELPAIIQGLNPEHLLLRLKEWGVPGDECRIAEDRDSQNPINDSEAPDCLTEEIAALLGWNWVRAVKLAITAFLPTEEWQSALEQDSENLVYLGFERYFTEAGFPPGQRV